ncbi:DUF4177 domain-containing protein [uncultured Roseobacter sp.]|uniref:DUF4177 domain-containing protein n=1 Tax=uncultured Roseobacter sp. TaxID=114847 RepID=UPI002637DDD1|nr:DUF4177 domain-containing protein [uncultured Roseobacter sp.]
MTDYQYKVIAAPAKGLKARGIKTPEARFAHAVEEVLNEMARDGWEYQRAEALPSQERAGFASTTTNWRNLLVFRKPVDQADRPALRLPAEPAAPRAERAADPGPELRVPDGSLIPVKGEKSAD